MSFLLSKLGKKTLLATSISVALSTSAYAENLYQVFSDAVENDPIIKAAEATLKSEQQAKWAAMGQFFPQVGVSANYTQTDSDTNRRDLFIGNTLKTNTQGYTIAVTQNLFNLPVYYAFRGAEKLSRKATLDFRKNEQELISRTLTSYLNVLRAYDNLSSSLAEEAAFKQQLDQTRQRFDVGLVAITDVHESQAAYDLAKVSRLANQGLLETTYEGLTLLTGKTYSNINLFSQQMPINDPTPIDRSSWVQLAQKGNLELLSTKESVEAANYGYKQSFSAYMPTVRASYTYTERETVSGELTVFDSATNSNIVVDDKEFQQLSNGDLPSFQDSAIAVTLEMPIFTGGSRDANRRKAAADLEVAQQTLNGIQRKTVQEARANHISVITQIQTVAARKQAITSAESAVEAIEAGYQVGTRNIVDVLNAQRNLYSAQKDYANARYDYIESMIELKLSAGLLSVADIQSLNEFIGAQPATQEAAYDSVQQSQEGNAN